MNTDRIAAYFKKYNYTWQFSDGLRVPTAEEIGKTIDSAVAALSDLDGDGLVEIGRLLIKKHEGHIYIYALFADFK